MCRLAAIAIVPLLGVCACGGSILNGTAIPKPTDCRRPADYTVPAPPIVAFRITLPDSLTVARSLVVGVFQAFTLPITTTSDNLIRSTGFASADLLVGGSRQRQISVSLASPTPATTTILVTAEQHNSLMGISGTSDTPLTSSDGGAGGEIWCISQAIADSIAARRHVTVTDVSGNRS